jgi:hypothetical protein
VLAWQGGGVLGWQGGRVAEWQGGRVAVRLVGGIVGGRQTWRQNGRMEVLHGAW